MRACLLLLALISLPASSFAATVSADRSVDISVSPSDNAYLAGGDVRIQAPLPADLLAAAATLRILAPVGGDIFVVGGTIELGAPAAGDMRAAGGHIVINDMVTGDLAALGAFVKVIGQTGNVNVAGGTVELLGGSHGAVNAYGGTVTLAGTYDGNVHVVASDRIIVSDNTVIRGVLEYNAPQEAQLPESAIVEGGVRYVGSASFLPTAEEAQAFALAGVGIFLVVRLLAFMLVAGLLTGLFPTFARRLVDETLAHSFEGFMKVTAIGLILTVVTPLIILLLLVSFVGMGVALLLGAAYALLLVLGYLYAATLAGSMVARKVFKRDTVLWRDAVIGVVILYVIGMIPVIGFVISFVLAAAALGALASLFYSFAYKRDDV